MISRRSFIQKSALTAAMAPVAIHSLLSSCSGNHHLKKIGFISGIIGKELRGDWKSVLKKTVDFGFSEIETGEFLGDSAKSFLDYCKEIGLAPIAGGIDFNAQQNELEKRLDVLKQMDIKYAVVYWPWSTGGPFTLADCQKSAVKLNKQGAACQQKDMVLCWHNHNLEFTDMEEGLPFNYLMEHTNPETVQCEMDVYWVKKGGGDPLALIQKYGRRIPILHVKDMAPGSAQDFECPGSGIIDFPALFKEAQRQGIQHYFVERDNVTDGMACLQSSGEYLRNLRF